MQILLWQGANDLTAASGGFIVGLVTNYLMHSRLTFNVSVSWALFFRYLVLLMLNYALTLVTVYLVAVWLGNPLAGKVISLPLVAINSFMWGKFWVFKAS